jgi:hypothetical protein
VPFAPQANNSLEIGNVGRLGALGLTLMDIRDVLSNRKGISGGGNPDHAKCVCGCGIDLSLTLMRINLAVSTIYRISAQLFHCAAYHRKSEQITSFRGAVVGLSSILELYWSG